jgi:L-seryl-tRNA(Ser) seleniumtransferase
MDHPLNPMLREIPNVHDCINGLVASNALDDIPLQRIKYCTRRYLDALRQSILSGEYSGFPLSDRQLLLRDLIAFVRRYHQPCLTRVINGTGVIVHTNLGRSLLPASSIDRLVSAGTSYSNLELNLATGKRGSRYGHVDGLLCELTGAEAALVVNNNAAAVLLALETLAKGKEVIVSRGQLVEIGGSFRIPDIMRRSGAHLVEVGTTNRTHFHDYQAAVTGETGLLLRVHCSNYRIVGFTSEVANAELVQLGKTHDIPVMEDLGSGCLLDLSRFGLVKEPTVQEAVASGLDIVTFSGDKLLGGPQAGIIIGKKKYIDQIKNNPLNRALRIDKLTLAALEAVLRLYLDESQALREIPTLAMIAAPEEVVARRARILCEKCIALIADQGVFAVVRTQSQVGGGAMPEQNLASWGVTVQPTAMKVSLLEKRLRQAPLPVIGRTEADCLLLDLRTVADEEIDPLVASLRFALVTEKDRPPE